MHHNKKLEKLIKSSFYTEIATVHGILLGKPEEVNRIMEEFLSK